MKKTLILLVTTALVFAACKKSDSSGGPIPTFTATIDGKATTFNITQSTLLRSAAANSKRMDVVGVSTDNSTRIVITLGLETSQGSGMTVKSYVLNPTPADDPNTPDIDESLLAPQGFTTYSTYLGSNNWLTNTYYEQGLFTITSCDSAHTTFSGTFATTLTSNSGSPVVSISITDGKMDNVKYWEVN